MNGDLREISFDGLIWAIRPDAACENFGLQLRFPEAKEAQFVLVAAKSGKIGPAIRLENSWWSEALAVFGDIFLIGMYQDAGMPVFGKIMAVDGKNGEVIWERADFQFQNLMEDCILGTDLSSQSPICLAVKTGEILSEFEQKPALAAEIRFPNMQKSEDGKIISILKHNEIEIVAWHEETEATFTLMLEAGPAEQPLFHLALEENMEKMHPEPFFVAKDWLVAIQARKTLILWPIPIER